MVGNPIFCYATYGCKFFCSDLRIITDYFKNGFRSVGRSFRSCFRSVGRSFRSLFDIFSQFKTSFDSVRITLFFNCWDAPTIILSSFCDNIGTCTTFFTNSQEYKHLLDYRVSAHTVSSFVVFFHADKHSARI